MFKVTQLGRGRPKSSSISRTGGKGEKGVYAARGQRQKETKKSLLRMTLSDSISLCFPFLLLMEIVQPFTNIENHEEMGYVKPNKHHV